MARHLDRKTLKEDAFRDSMFWALDWVWQRRMWFISGAVTIVLLVVGGFGYYYYHRSVLREQSRQFYEAERATANPELKPEERTNRARKTYEEFIARYPDSALAPVAWMHVARLAWQQNDAGAARKAYEAVLAHPAASEAQRDLAHIGLAKLDESQGKLEASAEQYQAVKGSAYEELKALSLGRIASARNQNEEAHQYFEKAARAGAGSPLADWARQNLDYHP